MASTRRSLLLLCLSCFSASLSLLLLCLFCFSASLSRLLLCFLATCHMYLSTYVPFKSGKETMHLCCTLSTYQPFKSEARETEKQERPASFNISTFQECSKVSMPHQIWQWHLSSRRMPQGTGILRLKQSWCQAGHFVAGRCGAGHLVAGHLIERVLLSCRACCWSARATRRQEGRTPDPHASLPVGWQSEQ